MRRIVLFIWCSFSAAGAASAVGCGPTDASTEDAERGKCYIDDMICRDGQCYCFVKRGPDEWSEDECGDELFCYTEPPRCECTRPLPGAGDGGGHDGGGGNLPDGEGEGEGHAGGNGGNGREGEGGNGHSEGEGEGEVCDSPPCGCNGDPPWFDGEWLVEYPYLSAVRIEYDFTASTTDRKFWHSATLQITQNGCALECDDHGSGNIMCGTNTPPSEMLISSPPYGFARNKAWVNRDEIYWLVFQGNLSDDHQKIDGECRGVYPNWTTLPITFFGIECSFTLTRQ